METEKVLKAIILILLLVLLLIPVAIIHSKMVNFLADISANLAKMIFHYFNLH